MPDIAPVAKMVIRKGLKTPRDNTHVSSSLTGRTIKVKCTDWKCKDGAYHSKDLYDLLVIMGVTKGTVA